MRRIIASLAVCALVAGCRSPGRDTAINRLMSQTQEKYAAGDVSGAIKVLDAALSRKKFRAERPWLFSQVLSLMLSMPERTKEARERYLAVLGVDEQLTRGGFVTMYRYFLSRGDGAAVLEWTDHLVNAPLPADLAEMAASWRLTALLQAGRYPETVELAWDCLKRFDAVGAARLLDPTVRFLVSKGRHDEADAILRQMEAEGSASSVEFQRTIQPGRLAIAIARGKWDDVHLQFWKAIAMMQDGERASALRDTVGAALKNGRDELARSLCEGVLADGKQKETVKNEASRLMLEMEKARAGADGVAPCLDKLLGMGAPPGIVATLYEREFYSSVEKAAPDAIAALVKVGRKILPMETGDTDKAAISLMLVDGCFMIEDYQAAVAIVESGIPGKDEAWHQMAVSKINAHRALKEGREKDAVELFRKFMALVEAHGKSEIDPTTGMVMTKEMCLALNAGRISDILARLGNERESRQAHSDAVDRYKKALAALQPDSREYAFVTNEVARLMQVKDPGTK